MSRQARRGPSFSARIRARWTIEIGVAADRRGEMGVAAQVAGRNGRNSRATYSACACVRRTISLTTFSCSVPCTFARMPLNCIGFSTCPLASLIADRGQEFARALSFSSRRLVMGAIDQTADFSASSVSAAATLARIMNSSINLCASRRGGVHAVHRPVGVEHDLAFGQVEIERSALRRARASAPRRRAYSGRNTGVEQRPLSSRRARRRSRACACT